jgi:hypothetical protein
MNEQCFLHITLENGHQTPAPGSAPSSLGWYLGCGGLSYPPIPVPTPLSPVEPWVEIEG